MKRMNWIPAIGVVAVALGSAAVATAAPLFSDDFDADSTANWAVNNGPGTEAHDIYFDYSDIGIPSAPNSSGGTTRGIKLQANLSGATKSGVSVSPIGESFTGDYKVKFDLWSNFNGGFPGGGSGSTNLSTAGIGTAGTTAQWADTSGTLPNTHDGILFGATGDGGWDADWQAYSSAAVGGYGDGDPVFAAVPGGGIDTRSNNHPYYANFGNVAAPAAQVSLYPQQAGNTFAGASGMAWHEVEISKIDDSATWTVDGTLIATIDLTTVTLGGNNIFFGHSDLNNSSSSDVNDSALLFTLIDNVVVQAVPEPTSFALFGMGALLLLGRRRQD